MSFLTDRDPLQQGLAADLLGAAASGGPILLLHQTVLAETVYVLRNLYGVDDREIAGILRDLLAMPGILPLDDLSWPTLLELWPDPYSDFADAALAAVATRSGPAQVATFDRGLMRKLESAGLATWW